MSIPKKFYDPSRPDDDSRQQVTPYKKNLAIRDGRECWFCGVILPKDLLTIEHLLSIAHGGNDHISNLVLSCLDCNKTVGTWSIAKKVKFREDKRGIYV